MTTFLVVRDLLENKGFFPAPSARLDVLGTECVDTFSWERRPDTGLSLCLRPVDGALHVAPHTCPPCSDYVAFRFCMSVRFAHLLEAGKDSVLGTRCSAPCLEVQKAPGDL